ncbi:MAG: Short-chain-enoyl-CoA hydratase [Syntrophus sp. SKADARSKE-3]|nr:Short-chain-enoyl-CoA hydratase [Syntrophus sp. SKADARSKE-3]
MAILEWKKDETVAVITLTNGENRFNPDFNNAVLNSLQEIEQDSSISSVIITSNDPKNWSQGIDLFWMMDKVAKKDMPAVRSFLYGANDLFKRIVLYPMPVIAAINGHAFGDGSILACCCDFRFMKSDKGFFCFPEVDIDIPFLPGMLAMLRKAIPYYKMEEAVFSGKKMGAKELEEHHVILKACDNDAELQKEALAFAKTFTKKRPIFGELKRRMNKNIVDAIEKEDPPYIDSVKF